MPWSPAQHRLFEAAAHDPAVAQRVGIPQAKAGQLASEGIAKALRMRQARQSNKAPGPVKSLAPAAA